MSHVTLAMAYGKLHQPDQARTELAEARGLIEPKFPNGLKNGLRMGNDLSGLAHDWIMSFILLREARSDLEDQPQFPK
jgi:hypothetical protein